MRHFRIRCVLRVLLLALTLAAAVYVAVAAKAYGYAAFLALVAVYQVADLIRYVERTSRDVGRFLWSIRYADFSQTFAGQARGAAFEELHHALNGVMDYFRAERAEKEASYHYLQTVMQHVGIAMISYRADGTVNLVNRAAKRLLRVGHLKRVSGLQELSPALVQALLNLKAGEKALVQVVDGDELLQLAVYTTEFKLQGELYRLASIQNIRNELEEKELDAWQQLTRVLTHEIMNSLTPITSLASTAGELLSDAAAPADGENPEAEEALRDAQAAVQTIERRGRSLMTFVHAYRSLTHIPTPNLSIVPIRTIFKSVGALMRRDLDAHGIRLVCETDPDGLDLAADPELVEQVLINLVKNAREALSGTPDPEIRLTAGIDRRGRTVIQVIDNGPGIVEEALEKIFIPFFTTKKEGSGIGLSLSRQIMRRHGGTLTVHTEPGKRTAFTLRF